MVQVQVWLAGSQQVSIYELISSLNPGKYTNFHHPSSVSAIGTAKCYDDFMLRKQPKG